MRALSRGTEQLNKWTLERLERRHSIGGKGLLSDSEKLGFALERIPGPGVLPPLEPDEYQLPSGIEIEELAKEVGRLNRRILMKNEERLRPAELKS